MCELSHMLGYEAAGHDLSEPNISIWAYMFWKSGIGARRQD